MANSSSTTGTDSATDAPGAGAPATPAKVADVRKRRPVISVGSSGDTVATLQKALNAAGKARAAEEEVEFQPIELDGVFGYHTAKELKKFQRSEDMAADGVVSEAVWEALKI